MEASQIWVAFFMRLVRQVLVAIVLKSHTRSHHDRIHFPSLRIHTRTATRLITRVH
jgi:hypothetical protein